MISTWTESLEEAKSLLEWWIQCHNDGGLSWSDLAIYSKKTILRSQIWELKTQDFTKSRNQSYVLMQLKFAHKLVKKQILKALQSDLDLQRSWNDVLIEVKTWQPNWGRKQNPAPGFRLNGQDVIQWMCL